MARTTTTPMEAVCITAVCFGFFIGVSVLSMLADFPVPLLSNASLTGLLVTELMLALTAIVLLRIRGYAVHALIPRPSWRGTINGAALYGMMVALYGLLNVMARSNAAEPIAIGLAHAQVSASVVIAVAVVNGAFEEVFLLGFLLRGLRACGLSVALGATIGVRVLSHVYQGPMGACSAVLVGVILGLAYVRSSNLWPPVFAHMVADVVPFMVAT